MDLSQEQKEQVAGWIAAGEGLSVVQDKLAKELGLSMTFMEVRFLVDDLNLELQDALPSTGPKAVEGTNSGETSDVTADAAPLESNPEVAPDAHAELVDEGLGAGGGSVSVTVDKVQRPGAVVSGGVTFSDGVSAQWQIDSYGQLGIIPPPEKDGYQPSPEDIQDFQTALQSELRKQGF